MFARVSWERGFTFDQSLQVPMAHTMGITCSTTGLRKHSQVSGTAFPKMPMDSDSLCGVRKRVLAGAGITGAFSN